MILLLALGKAQMADLFFCISVILILSIMCKM